MFWANFSTALGDVTHSKTVLFLSGLLTIPRYRVGAYRVLRYG
jgi:hypothetical protein